MDNDFDYYLDEYGDEYYDDMYGVDGVWDEDNVQTYEEEVPLSFMEAVDSCVLPSVSDAFWSFGKVVVYCFLFRFVVFSGMFSASTIHMTSVCLGLLALYQFFGSGMIYIIFLVVSSYFVLLLIRVTIDNHYGPAVALYMVIYVLLCELMIVDPVNWHSIRGSQMILSMKILSFGFDLDMGVQPDIPSSLEYSGYTLCIGSVIFGPWHSYRDYNKLLHKPVIDRRWFVKLFRSTIYSFFFLIISTCGAYWMLGTYSNRWVIAYRDALSFRTSHYFVSFMSEVTAVGVGLGSVTPSSRGGINWEIDVSRPHYIEVPRSLVEVVISWNIPMHQWLYQYVFKKLRCFGKFVAILGTYAASSLLHGLNFQLAAVLLSLGFYTYIEHELRKRLAETWDACIEARGCKDCDHSYKKYHPAVLLCNIGFGALAMFHLAYLGVMFNSESAIEELGYNMWHTVTKWAELDFASHWVAIGTCIIHYLIG